MATMVASGLIALWAYVFSGTSVQEPAYPARPDTAMQEGCGECRKKDAEILALKEKLQNLQNERAQEKPSAYPPPIPAPAPDPNPAGKMSDYLFYARFGKGAVSVVKGTRILTHFNLETGKPEWEIDIIKECGAPSVGEPVIRQVSFDPARGEVTATYGKHSSARVDLKTGKILEKGSD